MRIVSIHFSGKTIFLIILIAASTVLILFLNQNQIGIAQQQNNQTSSSITMNLKEQMAKMNELVEKLHGYVELYKPAFETVMKQANPHLGGKFIDIDMSIVKENWPSREKKTGGL